MNPAPSGAPSRPGHRQRWPLLALALVLSLLLCRESPALAQPVPTSTPAPGAASRGAAQPGPGAALGPAATNAVTGTVTLQGRTPDFPTGVGHGIATVTLTGDNAPPPTMTNASGAFTFGTVPDGTYTLTASAPGYLSARRTIKVSNNSIDGSLQPIQLPAGLVTQPDTSVTIADVTALIGAFGSTPPGGVSNGNRVDINGDGVVNLRDLTLVLGNFGKAAPVGWALLEPPPPPPPDPVTVAPPPAGGEVTAVGDSTAFLYTGPNAIQTGVAANTIQPARVAVLRGRVTDRSGIPLASVKVTALGHPEYGQTATRGDGWFDFAVNGGAEVTLQLSKSGYPVAQRSLPAPWADFVVLPDIALVPFDAAVTAVDLTANTPFQVVRATAVTDSQGTRRATLLVPQGTTATATLTDGTSQPLPQLNIRITEYTVGPNGPAAMPAELPPTSGYTYAVEFSVDQVEAAGGGNVSFSQPLWFYAENYLGFPVGTRVPLARYDRARAEWIPTPDGRVIKFLSVTGDLANLDLDGDGVADNGAALGISDAERRQLALLYTPGQTLSRMPVQHFSPLDPNYPIQPITPITPDEGPPPDPPSPRGPRRRGPPDKPERRCGSIIACESQVLGESLPVTGTPYTLNYWSDRVPDNRSDHTITIPITPAVVPSTLKRVLLEVHVAGRQFNQQFSAAPNQTTEFTWDGRDAYNRIVDGQQPVRIRIGRVYDGVRAVTALVPNSFGTTTAVPFMPLVPAGEITNWDETLVTIGATASHARALGGWTLDVHHSYDPVGRVLHLGDGRKVSAQSLVPDMLQIAAGTGIVGTTGDSAPATAAQLSAPIGATVGPDGSIYIADTGNHRIRKVAPNGVITTVAGTGAPGFGGDGGPATAAQLFAPFEVVVTGDGSLYIADTGNNRVRRVAPNGVISTVAGGPSGGTAAAAATQRTGSLSRLSGGNTGAAPSAPAGAGAVEGVTATTATLNMPSGIAVTTDGALYIAELQGHRVRRVAPDGTVSTVAGIGFGAYSGDNGPAQQAALQFPTDVDVTAEGVLYIADRANHAIRRVGPDGFITTVAGALGQGNGAEGIRARNSQLNEPIGVTTTPDGRVLIVEANAHRIRQIDVDGIITTIAGTGTSGDGGDSQAALATQLNTPQSAGVAPDGSLVIADTNNHHVRAQRIPLPGATATTTEFTIPDESGGLLYVFSKAGRHLRTRHSLTGATLLEFTYTPAGLLAGITDGFNNVTTIERNGSGAPTGILGPYGQRTTLTVGGNGFLSSVTNPANETTTLVTTPGGLLTSITTPRNQTTTFAYTAEGRLRQDNAPDGSVQTLTRTGTPADYVVTHSTLLDRDTVYTREQEADGDQAHSVTDPDGSVTQTTRSPDGVQTVEGPSGLTTTTTLGPDPRFGMQSPIAVQSTLSTPGGRTHTAMIERTATFTDPSDPLSLIALSVESTQNTRTTTMSYNPATRTMTVTSPPTPGAPQGRMLTMTMDLHGRTTGMETDGLEGVAIGYDSRGRLSTVTAGSGPEARTTTYAYNPQGFLASVTDPIGRVTSFTYDAVGQITSQTLPGGRTVATTYDADGNLTSVTPPGQPAYSYARTPTGRLASRTLPAVGMEGSTTQYAHNADGDLTGVTRPDGTSIAYTYDTAGRLATMTMPRGTVTYGYQPGTGLLNSISAPGALTLGYTYDGPLPLTESWGGAVAGSVTRAFNNDMWVSSLSVNGANPVPFTYDAEGVLSAVGDLSFARASASGLVTSSTLNTVTDAWTYNGFGEPATYLANAGATSLYSAGYMRSKLGRLTAHTESFNGPADSYAYTYDAAGRLATVTKNNVLIATYVYDGNGNRTSVTTPGGTTSATYDARDRLLTYGGNSYGYNAAGTLATKTTMAGMTTYTYDQMGNLTAVALPGGTQIAYLIDGVNRRIGKRVNGILQQGWLYQDGLRPIAELDGAGQVVSRFVYAGSESAPAYMVKNGVTYRLISDHVGSVRLVVNAADGTVAQRLDYDEYGRVTQDTSPGFQPFGFAGGLYDPNTGLTRFGARDYDAETGRWTAPDPIGFHGGATNLYEYALGDPVNFTDPTGLAIDCWGVVKGLALIGLGIVAAGVAVASGPAAAAVTATYAVGSNTLAATYLAVGHFSGIAAPVFAGYGVSKVGESVYLQDRTDAELEAEFDPDGRKYDMLSWQKWDEHRSYYDVKLHDYKITRRRELERMREEGITSWFGKSGPSHRTLPAGFVYERSGRRG